MNALDRLGAINQMRATSGWKILMERYAKEGDELLDKILDTSTAEDVRRLHVFQLETLGKISKILTEIENEAKNEQLRQKEPSHIGK